MTSATSSTATLDPWQSCEQQLNQRLIEPMLRQYEDERGRPALAALAEDLGTSLEVLEDPDRWFSADLFLVLIRRMKFDLGDGDITYRAGRLMSKPGMMGAERILVQGVASPSLAYQQISKISGRLSRITSWEVKLHRRGRATAKLVLAEGVKDAPEFCRNRVAVLEAIPVGFGLPAARVRHPTCLHRPGQDDCIYEISWAEEIPYVKFGWYVAAGLLAGAGVAVLAAPGWAPWLLGGATAAAVANGIADVYSVRRVERGIQTADAHTVEELQKLLERNDRRLSELHAIARATAEAAAHREEDPLIDAVLRELVGELDYDRALMLRTDESGERLGRARSVGFGKDTAAVERLDVSVRPDKDDDRLFGNILRDGASVLVRVDDDYLATLLPQNRALLERLRSRSFVAAPITDLGLLVVDRTTETPLSLRDRDVVASVADALGTAISNVRQLRRVQTELLINQKFQQYLPAQAAEEILADPQARLRLGGERREIAVMFTDIAGFTRISAGLAPEEVVRGLNAWFSITDPIIRRCGGIVDKRMGDGILVVFLPEAADRMGRHPVERAAAAAVGMCSALEERRPAIAAGVPGFAAMEVRHAIHYGAAIVGNMGSEERMEYTVIGDAVNTASRVEGITPPSAIYLTGEAVQAVGGGGLVGAALVDTVELRGREGVQTELWSLEMDSEATESGTWVAGLMAISGEFSPADVSVETTSLTAETGELGDLSSSS